MIYWELSKELKEEVVKKILQLRQEWLSLRWIATYLDDEDSIIIWKTTVSDIISRHEIEDIEEEVWEKEVEYDEQNLFVYTTATNKYWEKVTSRHSVPFELINRIQKAYVRKGKNRTWDQILTFNWWTDDNPIILKPKVWEAIKSATWLQKTCGIANEIFLKILYDKFGKAEVEGYLEELAYDTTRERFREIEEWFMNKAKEKQFDDVLRRDAKLEVYLERIWESVKNYTPKNLLTPNKNVFTYEDHLIIAFGDLHTGRTTDKLEQNMQQLLDYILQSGYQNISLINVGDNLETPLLQWMHVSQILDMDYRGFEQMLKCAELLESLLASCHNAGKNVEMFGIAWNHCFLKKENPLFLTEIWFKTFDEVKNWNLKLWQIKDWKTYFGNFEDVIEWKQKWTYCRFWKQKTDARDFVVTDWHKFILDWDKFEAKEIEVIETKQLSDVWWDYNFDKYDIASLMTIFDWSVVIYNTSEYYHKKNKWIVWEELDKEESKKKTRIQFKISKPEKIEWIEQMFTELWINYTKQLCKKSWWNILQPYYIRIYSDDAKEIAKRIWKEKKVPIEWYSINEESKLLVKEIISRTDWTLRWNNLRMYNTDLDLIYWVQCIFKSNRIHTTNKIWYANAKPWYELAMSYDWTVSKQIVKKETYFWEEEICDFQTETWTLIVSVWLNTFVHSNCRWNKHTDDDPERLPWLAVYEIVKSRLQWHVPVTYFKNNVNTFICGKFNIILSHWENWFANKNWDQIANLKGSPFHYSLIINWHLHTPKIEQGSWRTKIQTPSMNNQDRYADTIIMKESLPWFVTIETVNNLPKIAFHNCMSD